MFFYKNDFEQYYRKVCMGLYMFMPVWGGMSVCLPEGFISILKFNFKKTVWVSQNCFIVHQFQFATVILLNKYPILALNPLMQLLKFGIAILMNPSLCDQGGPPLCCFSMGGGDHTKDTCRILELNLWTEPLNLLGEEG